MQKDRKKLSRKFHGFTLVELIVVITILVILGTIAFMSLSGFSANARDSARASDLSNLSKSLDVAYQKTNSYPSPDNSFSVTYSGWVLWNQGTIGDSIVNVISAAGVKLSKKPTDPLKNTQEYTYSKVAYGNSYQLKTDWEGDSISYGNFPQFLSINSAFAANGIPAISYIKGNYGGLVTKTQTGNTTCILALPSIVVNTGSASTPIIALETNNLLSGSLLLHRGNLTWTPFKPSLTWPWTPVVYCSGSLPSSVNERLIFATNLANAYSGTSLAVSPQIQPFVNALTTSDNTSLVNLGGGIVSNALGGTSINNTPIGSAPVNCNWSWGICSLACTQIYTITTPASGWWLVCSNLNNESRSCTGGSCPAPGTCNNAVINGCTTGTPINQVAGSCNWSATWNCSTAWGTSVQCSKANVLCPINGVCSATPGVCSAGTASADNGATACSTTRTWNCLGINLGSNVSCSSVNAACCASMTLVDPNYGQSCTVTVCKTGAIQCAGCAYHSWNNWHNLIKIQWGAGASYSILAWPEYVSAYNLPWAVWDGGSGVNCTSNIDTYVVHY